MSKFIILALARSGSSSLARLLNESPDVELCFEPFHPDYTKWYPGEPNFQKRVTNKQTLDKTADDIFSRFTAIKTLNYQLDTELYIHLMKRESLRILLLYRKDVLASLLSAEISKQTGAWQKDEMTEEARYKYSKLKPLDIDWLHKSHDFITSQNREFRSFLEKHRPGDYMELFYENLYSDDTRQNTTTITEICDFLDVQIPNKTFVEQYMSVSTTKLNFADQYALIPNYHEILKSFGRNS